MIEKNDNEVVMTFGVSNEDYSIPEFLSAIDELFQYWTGYLGPEYPEDAFCDALEMYIKHHRIGYI